MDLLRERAKMSFTTDSMTSIKAAVVPLYLTPTPESIQLHLQLSERVIDIFSLFYMSLKIRAA